MAFMNPEIEFGRWYRIETTHGTEIVPLFVVGHVDDAEELAPYCEGTVESWDVVTGYGWRLSASGYLDYTEWDVIPVDDPQSLPERVRVLRQVWDSIVEQYPEVFEFVLQDGTIHRYCESETEAQAFVDAIQTTRGNRWERDGDFIYCLVGAEQDAIAELEAGGFSVREI